MHPILNTELLKKWFLSSKRDLPWRETSDPYAIWISEIMLQQTQVVVVVPYYLNWMARFPTITALAEAEPEEVVKMWEGLGYYSRARNLHEGARYLVKFFHGVLPDTETELLKIKGLGPYTTGAILSFAFHQKKAAVDGNVLRVIARCYQISDDIAKTATHKKIRRFVETILPEEEPWITNEALIELGATICQRKPKCHQCPLSGQCLSHRNGNEEHFPVKSKGPSITNLYRSVAILKCGNRYLVKKGKQGAIMADLYEFPFIETQLQGIPDHEFLRKIKNEYRFEADLIKSLPRITHSFTRYKVCLSPYLLQVAHQEIRNDYEWLSLKELTDRPFSSGHRRILQHLL